MPIKCFHIKQQKQCKLEAGGDTDICFVSQWHMILITGKKSYGRVSSVSRKHYVKRRVVYSRSHAVSSTAKNLLLTTRVKKLKQTKVADTFAKLAATHRFNALKS